jgi:hypothetical protein
MVTDCHEQDSHGGVAMMVDSLDSSVFAALQPYELERYLAVSGWREITREPGTVAIWERQTGGELDRVWLPLNIRLSDYAVAVGRVIRTIATTEARSQLQIIEELNTTYIGDVFSPATWDEQDRNSTSLPYQQGVQLIRRAYQMASAAAMATANLSSRRPVYPNRPSSEVVEYLQKLRLGQTERGSYRIKLISPIASLDVPDSGQLPGLHETEPFGRKVAVNLMRGLDALRRVAGESERRGRFSPDPFRELVGEGVSANLCDAVVGEDATESSYSALEVNIAWSSVLRAPAGGVPQTVSFPKPVMYYIALAGDAFRDATPLPIALSGFVTNLDRDELGLPGQVVLVAQVDNKSRKVRITLPTDDYHLATEAHDQGIKVAVEGQLVVRRQRYYLTQPRNFRWISDADSAPGEQLELSPQS